MSLLTLIIVTLFLAGCGLMAVALYLDQEKRPVDAKLSAVIPGTIGFGCVLGAGVLLLLKALWLVLVA